MTIKTPVTNAEYGQWIIDTFKDSPVPRWICYHDLIDLLDDELMECDPESPDAMEISGVLRGMQDIVERDFAAFLAD